MSSLTALTWTALTSTINEMKSSNSFLSRVVFGNVQTHPTEAIELSLITRGRKIAPFVKKNGSAIMVEGHGETFKLVQPTNIRIKRPFEASELLFNRRPGSVVFAGQGTILQAAQQHIARDLQGMNDDIENAEEWLSALAIQGVITYEVADQESYTVDFSKPAANTIVLAGTRLWDDADATLPRPDLDAHVAKRLVHQETGLVPTDCLLGEEAAEQFLRLATLNPAFQSRRLETGTPTMTTQFSSEGVIFLGRVFGMNFWEYSRSADLNGVDTPMIRAKYAEFVTRSRAAVNRKHYGAIADLKVLQGRRLRGTRFSKSWEQDDPSVMWALAAARPLPVPERPGSMVSVKVVSG